MAATAKGRGPFGINDVSRLSFRCLPSDVDTNLHLNNARYPMLADIGRYDIFIRSGLARLMGARRWAPLMGGMQCVFMREIRLWQRFEVHSSLELWEGRQVMGRHRFILDSGVTSCEILTTAGIYDTGQKRFVEMEEIMQAMGVSVVSRQPTESERLFLASHNALRAAAKLDKPDATQ